MGTGASTGQRASPYKGLANYEEEDARFFFGRERDREIITANLAARRLTLLYGESGVGKSSVLRAGVVHDLRQRARRNLEEGRPPQLVPVVFSAWRDDPVGGLLAVVREAVVDLVGNPNGTPPRSSWLDESLQKWAALAGGELLLVLDQFEEYFLYHGDDEGEESFAEAFPRAVNRRDLRAHFLISIREDALAQLDRFKRRLPRLFESTLRIGHLDLEAAREAIEGPIAEYSKLLEDDERITIGPELVEAVLQQVKEERVTLDEEGGAAPATDGGPPRIEAPYLQLVMSRLWDEEARRGSRVLRLATLDELGGAEEIIRTHLDSSLGSLEPSEQDIAAAALRFLVTASGTKIAHTLPDLSDFTGRSAEELGPVLEKLSTRESLILNRLSGGPTDAGGARYEISHDVLAAAILDWRRRHRATELERKRDEAERRARRERRKARLAVAAAGAFLLLAAFAVTVSVWANHQKRVAQSERQLARSRAFLTAASDQLDKRLDRAIQLSLAAYAARPSAETRSAVITAVARSDRLRRIFKADAEVRSVAFSPDGSKLAVVERDKAVVWDGARRLGTAHVGQARVAAFTPDGELLALGGGGRIVLWDVAARRSRSSFSTGKRGLQDLVVALTFADGGRRLVAVTTSAVIAWDMGAGKRLLHIAAPELRLASHVDVSSDGSLVAYDLPGGGFAVRRIGAKGPVHSRGHDRIAALAFAPRGHRLAVVSAAGTLTIADGFSSSAFNTSVGLNGQKPTSVALGPQAQVAVGWDDGHIDAWRDVRNGASTNLRGHGDTVVGLTFSSDGTVLASGGADGVAELWTPWHSSLVRRLPGESALLFDVAFEGRALAATSPSGAILVWRALTGRPRRVATGSRGWAHAALSPDRRLLAATPAHGEVLLYDLDTGSRRVVQAAGPEVKALAFGPDATLAAASADGSVRIRSLRTLRQIARLHIDGVQRLAVDPDGTLLAAATAKGVSIWNVKSQSLDATPIRGTKTIDVAFSPDGDVLAFAEADGPVQLWDVKHRRKAGELSTEGRTPSSLAFSPDGATLAVGAQHELRGSLFLWDVKSRQQLGAAYEDPYGSVEAADFSDDGRLLALADGSITVTVLKNLRWGDVNGMRRRLCSVLGGAATGCVR